MNEHLRDRILRKLDTLTDERGYQILDFVEFLESRYAERQAPGASPFTRFAEAVEDRLRAGKVSASTIAEAMNMMNRAANVLNGALAAGRSVANDLVTASRTAGSTGAGSPTPSTGTPTASKPTTGAPPAGTPSSGSSGGASAGVGTTGTTPPPSAYGASAPPPPTVNTTTPPTPEASSPAHDTKMPGSGEEIL